MTEYSVEKDAPYCGRFERFRSFLARNAASAHQQWRIYITKWGPCLGCGSAAAECAEFGPSACCEGCAHPFLDTPAESEGS